MTHEEWAESERLRVQAAAIAHEHAVVAQVDTPPATADGDPLLAWLDNAPVGDLGVEAALARAVRAMLGEHRPLFVQSSGLLSEFGPICPTCLEIAPCRTRREAAEALGVTL